MCTIFTSRGSLLSSDVIIERSQVQWLDGKERRAWVVCLSAALFFFYEFIQMHMFNAINEALRHSFAVSATGLGWLSSTYLWADILFLLPAGIILDRYSTRKIILGAVLVCIIGTLGFAWSHSFFWAAFFHFLSGIGNAFCFLSCLMLISRWFLPNRQALVVGIVVTIAFLGGMVAQTPLALLAGAMGWRSALVLDGGLGLIIMAVIYCNVYDSPRPEEEHAKQRSAAGLEQSSLWQDLSQVFKNKNNWLPGIYTSLLNLPIMVLGAVWGKVYLQKVHHLTNFQATNVSSMIFLGSIIGMPFVGWLSDKWQLRCRPMVIGIVLTLLCTGTVMMSEQWSYGLLILLFFGIGLFSSTQIISYPMVTESNPRRLTGMATGLASVLIMGGALVGQLLYGKLLDMNWSGLMQQGQRLYAAGDYHFAMYMFPIAFVIGLLAITLARETHCVARGES